MNENDRISDKFRAIDVCTKRIVENLPKSINEYSKTSYGVKNIVERNLQLISDAQLDILAVIFKIKVGGIVGKEESLPDKLEGIVDKKALDSFRKRKKLRNSLVHAYAEFEFDKEVFEQASNLKDVENFKKAVEKLIG